MICVKDLLVHYVTSGGKTSTLAVRSGVAEPMLEAVIQERASLSTEKELWVLRVLILDLMLDVVALKKIAEESQRAKHYPSGMMSGGVALYAGGEATAMDAVNVPVLDPSYTDVEVDSVNRAIIDLRQRVLGASTELVTEGVKTSEATPATENPVVDRENVTITPVAPITTISMEDLRGMAERGFSNPSPITDLPTHTKFPSPPNQQTVTALSERQRAINESFKIHSKRK